MTYQALYRVWRPQTFEDVYGQEMITQTLQNAIRKEQPSHAYLFTGPRGTGKTSVAKIFQKPLIVSIQSTVNHVMSVQFVNKSQKAV